MERKNTNLCSIHPQLHFIDFPTECGTESHGMRPVFMLFIMLLMATVNLKAGDPVKIMPLGNSITAGEHYGRPNLPEQTGYRKVLYEMLIDTGYNVDFVGSAPHGKLPVWDTNWYDWNCEAYPGYEIPAIDLKLRAALKTYKPDILLVHVGTNGRFWDSKVGQVMIMLDSINKYSVDNDHPITVFLCKIIDQYYLEDTLTFPDPTPTSLFNIAVEDTVATRIGDKIKIIMVDMENGAGIDYTDSLPDPTAIPPYEGGDMWGYRYPGITYDKFHPNDKGNTKMAVKFYEELIKELEAPDSLKNNIIEDVRLSAIGITDSIQVTWTGNFVDEEGFIIERAIPGGAFSIVDTAIANTRYLIDVTAKTANEYVYRVKAFGASGETDYSSEIFYLPKVEGLEVSVTNDNYIKISWIDNLGSEDGFTVQRAKTGSFTYTVIATVSANTTSVIDNSADLTSKYTYIVRAFNSAAVSVWSYAYYTPPLAINETNSTAQMVKIYPNPVKDEVNFELTLPERSNVNIKIVDLKGAVMGNITNQAYDTGIHTITWNLSEEVYHTLQSGVYFCKISIGNEVMVRKLTLFK